MQATQHWHTNNLTVRMIRELWGTWNALVNALMRSGLVEISDIFGYDAPEMALAQNEHVVQAFASQTTEKALAKCVRARGFYRCFQDFNICSISHMLKPLAKFLIIISNEKTWSSTKRCGFAQLLGDPGVSGAGSR